MQGALSIEIELTIVHVHSFSRVEVLFINRSFVFILIFILLLLTGCNDEKSSEKSKPNKNVEKSEGYSIKNASTIHFKVGVQEFQIVPVFNPILEYIQKESVENYKILLL